MAVLDLAYDYTSLSLRDLLDARDLYHYHLLAKPNVVGTAIGRFLIYKHDDWPRRNGDHSSKRKRAKEARTFGNSEVRDYSWPCVLAFVRSWAHEEAFGPKGSFKPAQIVPKTLFLPDGRAVPVCVVQVTELPAHAAVETAPMPKPRAQFGGGLPIIVENQGIERVATAGCLVTDGHSIYTLTARHACGEPGTAVFSELRAGRAEVGVSSSLQITRKPFSEVYPDFAGRRAFASLDVGLVRVHQADEWTSNTYGLPPVGPLADVHERNLSLQLIGQPVVGFGAGSGLLEGSIQALFYRHRSVGGYDYVGDFLIAPGRGSQTRPGDSGMIWHLDVTPPSADGSMAPLVQRDLRPLAVEWGGQVFEESGVRSAFGVATSLSNVCKLLDVELVTDRARGVSGYWGRTGHYSIAALAITQVSDQRLKRFLTKNLGAISFETSVIKGKTFDTDVVGPLAPNDKFVPLADVPDEIWKKKANATNPEGGRDTKFAGTRWTGPEHPTHYADIDVAPVGQSQSLLALCLASPKKISPSYWLKFYADLAQQAEEAGDQEGAEKLRDPLHQGMLPFRLWQLFDTMTDCLDQGDLEGFLTAAGVSAHYMGDASQPLHGSVLADGDPAYTVVRHHPRTGKDETVIYGKGVHSAYETKMIADNATSLLKGIAASLGDQHDLELEQNGLGIARATLELMGVVAELVPPPTIIDAFEEAGAGTGKTTTTPMWELLGDGTIASMAHGARYLAMLWDSAWAVGDSASIAAAKLKTMSQAKLRDKYIDKNFAPSLTLDRIGSVLKK